MNAEVLKQWAVTVLVPVVSATTVTWLLREQSPGCRIVIAGLNSVLIFGVTTTVTHLAGHHILAGHYTPAAKAAAGRRNG